MTCGHWFSFPTVWVVGIELGLSSLAASTSPTAPSHWPKHRDDLDHGGGRTQRAYEHHSHAGLPTASSIMVPF